MKKIIINRPSSFVTALLMCFSVNVNALEPLSVMGEGSDGHIAQYTIDNKLTTWWSANGVDGTQWLQYQFKENSNISAVNIAFYKGDTRRTYFEIHRSDNGTDWTVALSASSSGSTTGLEVFRLDNAITDQYIRVVGLGSTKSTWNNITQVTFTESRASGAICHAGCELGDLGQPTASSSSDDGNGNVAANVLDDSDSYWSAKGMGEWIRLDIKKLQPINGVLLKFYKGDDRKSKFSIEVSTDGDSWTNVISEAMGTGTEIQSFKFETITARYVRYIGYGNTGTIWSGAWNSLMQFAVLPDLEPNDDMVGIKSTDNDVIIPAEMPLTTEVQPIEGCENEGKMELNGDCVDWLNIYEAEHGELAENAHLISFSPIEMKFNALAAQHETANGNGWRHELKIKSSGDYRVGMTDVYEEFKARIKINLSDGAKTIVAQHHAASTATITKLYVSDLGERGFGKAPDGSISDSVANNGVFDVFIRLAKEDGNGETKHLLTTVKSGESFDFEEINDHGVITVKINGKALPSITVNDSSRSYFKFGNYLQAQNPETGAKIYDKSDWPDFYAKYFTKSEIIFSNISYIRNVD